jgi:hypothetical protein
MLPSVGEGFGCCFFAGFVTERCGEGVTQSALIGLNKLNEAVDPCLVG